MGKEGVIVRQSPFSVKDSMDILQKYLGQLRAKVYARIDQQMEVTNAGQRLLPLEFILFGNPKAGGRLMAENPLVALDLPLKVIAWEDESREVWLAYNAASYIEERYSLNHNEDSPLDLDKMMEDLFGWCDSKLHVINTV